MASWIHLMTTTVPHQRQRLLLATCVRKLQYASGKHCVAVAAGRAASRCRFLHLVHPQRKTAEHPRAPIPLLWTPAQHKLLRPRHLLAFHYTSALLFKIERSHTFFIGLPWGIRTTSHQLHPNLRRGRALCNTNLHLSNTTREGRKACRKHQ